MPVGGDTMLTKQEIMDAALIHCAEGLGSFRPTTYHVRLGDEAFAVGDREVRRLRRRDILTVEPGQFALVNTLERIRMPGSVSAIVSGETYWGRRGLMLLHGLAVHPGFDAVLVFGLYNASQRPLHLKRGTPIANLAFFRHAEVPEKEWLVPNDQQRDGHIPDEDKEALRPMPTVRSLVQVDKVLGALEGQVVPRGLERYALVVAVILLAGAVAGIAGTAFFHLQEQINDLKDQLGPGLQVLGALMRR